MAYLKIHSSKNVWSRLHYVFDEEPHNDYRGDRVLNVTGGNIALWGPAEQPYASQSGYFINSQFKAIRRRARNKRKTTQCHQIILSMDEREFSTKDPNTLPQEARELNQLVKGFMDDYFPESSWVSAIQADGSGERLHAHIIINSVQPNGKIVPTSKLMVYRVRNEWNRYMENHYLAVTGRMWVNPFQKDKAATTTKPLGWQAQLQQTLEWARAKAQSLEQYLGLLIDKDVTVTERNKKHDWSYHVTVNGKDKKSRDFYQRRNKQSGLVTSTRGLGQAYTPNMLKQYFKSKNKKVDDTNDEESNAAGQRLQQLGQLAEQQRHRELIAQFTQRQADERRADDEAGWAGNRDGDCGQHQEYEDGDALGR